MKKEKIIIDTDPGVDDATALVLAMFDKKLDIKLITTVAGNIPVSKATRNVCHILDLYKKDIPVAKGADRAMERTSEDASFLHGVEGLGRYMPPATTFHQPLADTHAVDEMYKVICDNPHEVSILAWGPQTNLGMLFQKYPECIKLIKQIVFMGGSPWNDEDLPKHISFNVKTDPEAFAIVLDSGVPLVMVPSSIGRVPGGLTPEQIEKVWAMNDTGVFAELTYEEYWEPDIEQKMIATNDTCALFYLIAPDIFKTKRAHVSVLIENNMGKTDVDYNENGRVQVVTELNREKYIKMFFNKLSALDDVKLDLYKC